MEGIQGAVLAVKLARLDGWNSRRRDHACRYDALLAGCPGIRPTLMSGQCEGVYHLYTVRSAMRDALRAYLSARGIETGLHYPIPIHLQPAYRDLGYKEGDFPMTEDACATLLSLPMYAELSTAQLTYVAEAVREFHQAPARPTQG
jgi:dTDP-4-amino-4,6-dideoxygalactose transaminase